MFTYKEFFKKHEPTGIEKISRVRRSNIKSSVFERISDTESAAPRKSFRFKPALIAAAVTVAAVTGVTVGALASPPDVKLNGNPIEPYYNIYMDRDGSTVEILAVDLPPEMLGEEQPGQTPVGEIRLGRSELGDTNKDGFLTDWLIDENGDEYCCINNKIVSVKITYPDKVTDIHGFNPCNLIEHNYSSGYHGDGHNILFLPLETEVCGYTLQPECSIKSDYYTGAIIEIIALELPLEALGEPVPNCYFPGVNPSFISGAKLKLTDDYGNEVTPVLTDFFEAQEFPDGVNDLLIQINITYPDGTFETMRIDPINKLEGFNYDEIEFNYYIANFENMFDNDHNWLRDENGNAVYQEDFRSIINNMKGEED